MALFFLLMACAKGPHDLGRPGPNGDDDSAGTEDTATLDQDGDGFSKEDGDCDDHDDEIHPEAKDEPDDGVDSNCDGDEDS